MSRTLWEEGRQPGRLVVHATALAAAVLVGADLLRTGDLTWAFDVGFVLVCVGAALLVRPRDFFMVGVLPPLLMAGVVAVLAVADRSTVADPRDGFGQALVSGLAHHAGALVAGYGLTLAVLAMRQTARRNHGRIRRAARAGSTPRVPRQRRRDSVQPVQPGQPVQRSAALR